MKAFRNLSGTVVEIEVDVDANGSPILPPDTTVDPKPQAQPGHYVTVVGNQWVQIPIPQEYFAFEYKKQKALEKLNEYKEYYLNQPVEVNDVLFDADEKARNRLAQALLVYKESGYLPPAWITHDNNAYTLNSIDDLKAIINAVQSAFSTRFFEMNTIRQQILAAGTEEALSAIEIPTVPDRL